MKKNLKLSSKSDVNKKKLALNGDTSFNLKTVIQQKQSLKEKDEND